MKKYIIWGVIALVALYGFMTLRSLQTQANTVENSWAQVENQFQRRYDLIPNLVETVKGYAAHEKGVLTEVTEARARVGEVQINAKDLTPQMMEQYMKAQGDLTQALSRLLMVRESYPDLKANESFLKLQDELAGTENRIAVERKRFNDTVKVMNNMVTVFPSSVVASLFGFEKLPYFQIDEGAAAAPKVSF